MSFKRNLLAQLKAWKTGTPRKSLILRGARQVGKTTLIHEFSKEYKYYIALNLELPGDIQFFNEYADARTLIEALLIDHNIPTSEKHNTLLFIDEIQESPEAIGLLRYFYELVPELHVIAAGSLLEKAIREVRSFPVGRVQMLYLYPLNFIEFLDSMNQARALESIHTIPVPEIAHDTLLQLFNNYAIIGGMPEVVQKYIETKSVADVVPIYESIWDTYKNDVEKYSQNKTDGRIIKHIMSTAHLHVDERVKFQNFGSSNYRSREVGEAMRNLDDACVIQLIYPTTDVEVPVQIDLRKSPRLQFLDTGLINNELNIQSNMLGMSDLNNAYRGAIIPHLISQEIMSLNTTRATKTPFWIREKKQSSAEVDLVIQHQGMVIPIEIKSGKEGKLKSLHQFINATDHHYSVRMFAGKFSIEQHVTREGKSYYLMNLPYYLGTKIHEYLTYFTTHY